MTGEERAFAEARARMVAEQMRARQITDERVLAALERVPRHLFVNVDEMGEAYGDYPLPIGAGQTISQPYIVALMSELLQLTGGERVLEVGTGSGYQAAVLAELCQEVISIERVPEMAERAQRVLTNLGYKNISVITGDGSLGYAPRAPYEGIVVTAAAPQIAGTWIEQLSEGGRLVLPVGRRYTQSLVRITKHNGHGHEEQFGPVAFVPLIGVNGWTGDE